MTQYSDLMKQRSLAILLMAGGLYGLEKMLGVNPQEGGLAKYMDVGAKAAFAAGLVGYGISYIESKKPQVREDK